MWNELNTNDNTRKELENGNNNEYILYTAAQIKKEVNKQSYIKKLS